jgi:hypothetical protein
MTRDIRLVLTARESPIVAALMELTTDDREVGISATVHLVKENARLRGELERALTQTPVMLKPFIQNPEPGQCSWCGHPANSSTCQRAHP